MQVPDALRVAELFEADDVISVPAMACRVLARYTKVLEEQKWPMPDVMFQCVAMAMKDSAILDVACEYGYITEEQRDIAKRQMDS